MPRRAVRPERKENTMHRYPFIVDIPADEYHEAARRGEFLSSHLFGNFRAYPRLYRKKMSGDEPVDTAAYQVGRALHTLILEGRSKFDRVYLTTPRVPRPASRLVRPPRRTVTGLRSNLIRCNLGLTVVQDLRLSLLRA